MVETQKAPQLTKEEVESLPKATQVKLKILGAQKTGELIARLTELEEKYEAAVLLQAKDRQTYARLVSTIGGSDSQEVKEFLATLVPPDEINGKKATVPDKEAWLVRQRKENKELAKLLDNQKMAAFVLENDKNEISLAETRMGNVRAVMALRTAQFSFLGE